MSHTWEIFFGESVSIQRFGEVARELEFSSFGSTYKYYDQRTLGKDVQHRLPGGVEIQYRTINHATIDAPFGDRQAYWAMKESVLSLSSKLSIAKINGDWIGRRNKKYSQEIFDKVERKHGVKK